MIKIPCTYPGNFSSVTKNTTRYQVYNVVVVGFGIRYQRVPGGITQQYPTAQEYLMTLLVINTPLLKVLSNTIG